MMEENDGFDQTFLMVVHSTLRIPKELARVMELALPVLALL